MESDIRSMRTLRTLCIVASLALPMAVGCGDDDKKNDAVDDGTGGGSDEGTDDAGSEDPDAGSGGGDEEGDAGTDGDDEQPAPAPLEEVFQGVVEGVTDIRGLTYAADGKIYASGYAIIDDDPQVVVARFNADGSLDTTFGNEGLATHNVISAAADTAETNKGAEDSFGVVELASGDLIVQVNANDGAGGRNVALVKFGADGTFDDTFGVKVIDFGWTDDDLANWPGATPPSDSSWGLALDNSGDEEKVVIFGAGPAKAGSLDANDEQRTDDDRYIVRVLASDGSLDTDFATGGVFTVDVDGANLKDNARRGIVEADGSIISAGYTDFGEGMKNHVVLIRLLPDGEPDAAFGFGTEQDGVTKFNPFADSEGFAEAYSVARQATGRLVTTGYGVSNFEATSMGNDLVTFGILDGALDPAYGADGAFAVQSELDPNAGKGNSAYRENGRDIVRLPGDRTLHVGCYDDFSAVFLLTADGALDETFGDGGKLVFDHTVPFFNVALSPDGKSVAATTQGNKDTKVLLAIFSVNAD